MSRPKGSKNKPKIGKVNKKVKKASTRAIKKIKQVHSERAMLPSAYEMMIAMATSLNNWIRLNNF